MYTGNWKASDEEYEAAVEAAAVWLLESSPVRGGYASMGLGRTIGGSVTGSWTMDTGAGIALRGSVKVGRGQGYIGIEGGIKWNTDEGFGLTAQFGGAYPGVQWKISEQGNIKFGIPGPVGAGLILDPKRFPGLLNAWQEILNSDKSLDKCKKGS